MPNQCTYVDGIGSAQTIDTTGEIVDLAGLDCSMLIGGALNWQHKSDTPHQIIGKVVDFKKIFSEKDCENDRQSHFWKICQVPFLYVLGRLFDDKKDSAKEVAALFLDDAEHPNEHPMMWFSIEGSKIDKQGLTITKSIARKVTLTDAPANRVCAAQLLPVATQKTDLIDDIFKSEPKYEIELFKAEDVPLEKAVTRDKYGPAASTGHEKGVHVGTEFREVEKPFAGQSDAGYMLSMKHPEIKERNKKQAIAEHKRVLSEIKTMPKPKLGKTENVASKKAGSILGWKASAKNHPTVGQLVTFEHPNGQNIVTVHKDKESGSYHVKHNGGMANMGGQKGVFANARDALTHAKNYINNLNQGRTLSKPVGLSSKKFLKSEDLAKGAKGDWQKEGYTIEPHYIEQKGKKSLRGVHAKKDGKVVGSVSFHNHDTHLTPEHLHVEESHRRKGLASAMYNHAKKASGLEIRPSEDQTQEAKKLWESFEKSESSHNIDHKKMSDKKDDSFSTEHAKIMFDKESCNEPNEWERFKLEHPTHVVIEDFHGVGNDLGYIICHESAVPEWLERMKERNITPYYVEYQGEKYYFDEDDIEKAEKPFHGYNPKKYSKEGGLSDSYRKKYNREHGSHLKRPVTGKVKSGSKAAKRRKSFCARMKGVPGPTSKEGKLTPKGAALKRWKCSKSEHIDEALCKKERCWVGYEPVPGKKPYSKGSCRPIKKTQELEKTLSAGSALAAPAQLAGGAALGKEDLNKKKWLHIAKTEYDKWPKKEEFVKFMSEKMPKLSRGEIDAIGQTLALSKTLKMEKVLSRVNSGFQEQQDHSWIQKAEWAEKAKISSLSNEKDAEVIGHLHDKTTKEGREQTISKPIYSIADHPEHKNFSYKDRLEAAKTHVSLGKDAKENKRNLVAKYHADQAKKHLEHADRIKKQSEQTTKEIKRPGKE